MPAPKVDVSGSQFFWGIRSGNDNSSSAMGGAGVQSGIIASTLHGDKKAAPEGSSRFFGAAWSSLKELIAGKDYKNYSDAQLFKIPATSFAANHEKVERCARMGACTSLGQVLSDGALIVAQNINPGLIGLRALSYTTKELVGAASAYRGANVVRGSVVAKRGISEFQGLEVRAQRSLSHVDESTLRGMQRHGFSAKDANGNKLVLHHQQNPAGPIIEMPAKNHSIGNPRQHPYGSQQGAGLTKQQRDDFNQWRTDYWKDRTTQELNNRGL